jgi:hypothetical protein
VRPSSKRSATPRQETPSLKPSMACKADALSSKARALPVSAIYGRCRVAIPSTTSRTTILTFQGKPSRRRFFMAKHTRKLGVRSRDAREERREVFVGECISSSLSRFLNAGGLQRSIRVIEADCGTPITRRLRAGDRGRYRRSHFDLRCFQSRRRKPCEFSRNPFFVVHRDAPTQRLDCNRKRDRIERQESAVCADAARRT